MGTCCSLDAPQMTGAATKTGCPIFARRSRAKVGSALPKANQIPPQATNPKSHRAQEAQPTVILSAAACPEQLALSEVEWEGEREESPTQISIPLGAWLFGLLSLLCCL